MGDTIVAYHSWAFMCLGIFGMEWHLLVLEKLVFCDGIRCDINRTYESKNILSQRLHYHHP
jgi:hypothetical protein